MGKATGFIEFTRELPDKRTPQERIHDFKELYLPFADEKVNNQAARCMDCGVPFCHSGCPLGNIIPEFNDAVYHQNWESAIEILQSTNNFPEFTGRICPAPCEASCVLGINKPAVTIELIEKTIVEYAFENGLISSASPKQKTNKKIAIVGSGPAGLACAAQLNKVGHEVTVYERASAIGGLLRFGIPDFKLEKWVIDRRIKLMEEEGVKFEVNTNIGVNIPYEILCESFDSIVLCGGSTIPRDMDIPGRKLKGIHFAMDYLTQQNNRVANIDIHKIHTGEIFPDNLNAAGKKVIVIGGGDTGSDCVGTSIRQGAESVLQVELLPQPPEGSNSQTPWPQWPDILRTSSSQEEGCERQWSVLTKSFIENPSGEVCAILVVDIEWTKNEEGGMSFKEIPGSEREIECDLVLLAMGFLKGETGLMEKGLDIKTSKRGLLKTHNYQTANKKVFVAGDMRRGQSLVVWAISEGREAAFYVDKYLMVTSQLEQKDHSEMIWRSKLNKREFNYL